MSRARGLPGRLVHASTEEVRHLSLRQLLVGMLVRSLPSGTGWRVRARLYRAGGMRVGSGVLIDGALDFSSGSPFRQIAIGDMCFINRHVFIDAAAPVTIGSGVSIGHHVLLITTNHAVGPPEFRAGPAQPQPIAIGDGVWIAAGVTILPGVRVGAGAIVAAGAVVTRDVAANTLVGGVPAKELRAL